MTVNCHFCRNPIETKTLGVYRKVTGWAKIRAQGGSNAVSLQVEHDQWSCAGCITSQKLGINREQTSLDF